MNPPSPILQEIHPVPTCPPSLLSTLPQYLRMAQSMAGISASCLFLIDFHNGDIPFLESRILPRNICEAIRQDPDKAFRTHIPKKDQALFLRANKACMRFIHEQDPAIREDFLFSYPLHLIDRPTQYAIHLNISPIALLPDGRVWLALGALEPAANIDVGIITLRRKSVNHWYNYVPSADSFVQSAPIVLSRGDRELLLLTAKGHSSAEIAHQLHRSLHAVLSRKKTLSQKLNATSKTQALIRAINLRIM